MSDTQAAALQPGIRVRIPFGSRKLIAVLVAITTQSTVAPGRLKHALEIIDETPLLPDTLMELYLWSAQYYQHPAGEVFQNMLPGLLRQGRAARRQGRKQWQLSAKGQQLAPDSLRRAPRQQEIVNYLGAHQTLNNADIPALGISPSALKALQTAHLVDMSYAPASEQTARAGTNILSQPMHQLNAEQQKAVTAINNKLDAFQCFLLDGVTGSGKTEVYLQAISTVLQRSKQALVLVPEISLTPQTIARFRERFQCPIAVLHSRLTDTERLTAWLEARDGVAQIVIGTRSALFTPLARPGLIIIDEEHDSSFKQQDGFRYSARDLAVVRAKEENICVVLGSATPSLESLHNALSGRYQHLQLQERAGNARSPGLRLLDTRQEPMQEGFSATLLDEIQRHLQQANQVLVFINRRGFAPTLQCMDCGWTSQCMHCDARMTLHKSPPHLRCHHCNTCRTTDKHCPQCKSRHLHALGLGTERSEALLSRLFPAARVIRIDRDTTRRKNELESMLQEVQQGLPCILVGTQMLAKGHHFPRVTLVAVLDADSGLFSADFRGQEHTAQLLMQVAGRAGREDAPGEVLIQTQHASHATLQALIKHGYGHFARTILRDRAEAGMPPFSCLALIRAEAADFMAPELFLRAVRRAANALMPAQESAHVSLMGPLPAPMERRAGKFRAQLLLQAEQRGKLQHLLHLLCPAIENLKEARSVRWSVDVDPQDML
jgi:primosomal protein N' (replication factor Y)